MNGVVFGQEMLKGSLMTQVERVEEDLRFTVQRLGLTQIFVGVILVALVGNAAEHSAAVLVAMKNQMDLALGIASGSSMQIALFVAPVLVFVSYLFGDPLDLMFIRSRWPR